MVNRQNIQVLFDELRIEHVDSYLRARGWAIAETDNGGYRTFEIRQQGETRRVKCLASNDAPQFRSKLQNLVFSLAVLFEQEPIEIANAMIDSPVDTSTSGTPSETPTRQSATRLTLCNRLDLACQVTLLGIWSEPLTLPPGSRLELVVEPGVSAPPQLNWAADSVEVLVADAGKARFFEPLPLDSGAAGPTAIRTELESSPVASAQLAEVEPALGRIEFDLQDLGKGGSNQPFLLKSISGLVTALAHQFPESEATAELLGRVTCLALACNGTHLEAFPGHHQQLLEIARADDLHAPRQTLNWLASHTWNESTA